jgi:hypothetical protein
MAALVLVSLCAVGASAAQGNNANVQAPALVGAPVASGAPAVCSADGAGKTLDLFVRGADNALYWKNSSDGGKTWGLGARCDVTEYWRDGRLCARHRRRRLVEPL